ncbi:MAG: heavy-metal-associated domain-containing protein [Saprospiraceae bacterium]
MKYFGLVLSFVLLSTLALTAGAGNVKTETFKVYGNCGMCRSTIEKAAKSVPGVKSADWNVKTDMLTVSYQEDETTLDEIKKSIAASGYDSDTYRATDEAYNNLHGCCQYERPGT